MTDKYTDGQSLIGVKVWMINSKLPNLDKSGLTKTPFTISIKSCNCDAILWKPCFVFVKILAVNLGLDHEELEVVG